MDALKELYNFLQTALGTVLASLLLTWLVSSRISAYWAYRQKRKELDLAAAAELHDLYGEFVAIWKLWNRITDVGDAATRENRRVELLERATKMEARFESLLLRLTSQLRWFKAELNDLGLLRQAFHFRREQIVDNEKIQWDRSEHPQYLKFKQVSSAIGAKLTKRNKRRSSRSSEGFLYITKNSPHEDNFDVLGGTSNREAAAEPSLAPDDRLRRPHGEA